MKVLIRYTVCFIPVLFGGLISTIAIWRKTIPIDLNVNPYQDLETLDYLSNIWLLIGATFSVIVFFIMIIHDLFSVIGDKLEKARIDRCLKDENRG